jgi:hypothetical protein
MKELNTRVIGQMMNCLPHHIPEKFLSGSSKREDGDFDPNAYFEILTEIKPREDFVLDY